MALAQQKTNIALTHLNREYDPHHTSWSEIIAFSELLDNQQNTNIYLNEINEVMKHKDQFQQIYIFATGQLKDNIKSQINDYKGQIYLIIQDPNWPVQFEINREYTLITPFRKWSKNTLLNINNDIELLPWTISTFTEHIYFPFGLTLAYNKKYFDRYMSYKNDSYLDQNFNGYYIYAGSLKEDRKSQFKKAINLTNVAFYGNFTNDQLRKLTNEKDLQKSACKGKVNPYLIPHLYGKYEIILLMPDFLINYFDVSYIRYFEIYLAQILYQAYTILILSDDVHDQHYAYANLKNFSTFHKDLLEINMDHLIEYYEDGIDMKKRIYDLIKKERF